MVAQADFTIPTVQGNLTLPPNVNIDRLKTLLKSEPSHLNGNESFASNYAIQDNDDKKFFEPITHLAAQNPNEYPYSFFGDRANSIRPIGSTLEISDSGELKIKRGNNLSSVSESDKPKHLSAYLNFLNMQRENNQNQPVKFISTMMALTYISILGKRIGNNNNTLKKKLDFFKNIVEYNKLIYNSGKVDRYQFYDLFVTRRLKNFTTELLKKLTQRVDDTNINTNSQTFTYLSKMYIDLIKYTKSNSDEKIISSAELNKCISSLKKKINQLSKNKTNETLHNIINEIPGINNQQKRMLKQIKHYNKTNLDQLNNFRKVYKKELVSIGLNLNKFIIKLNRSAIFNTIKKGLFNEKYINSYLKTAKKIQKEKLQDIMETQIKSLVSNSVINQNAYKKQLKQYRDFYAILASNHNDFSTYPELFEKKIDIALKNTTKSSNKIKNLSNLKNQIIKNIELNGANSNSVPSDKELNEMFKTKPALLREIKRAKRTISTPNRVYKEEINHFMKTGTYKPIAAYEKKVVSKIDNQLKINKAELKKARINLKNHLKNQININNNKPLNNETRQKLANNLKVRTEKTEELKKKIKELEKSIKNATKLRNETVNKLKNGLINKSKGINIDAEADSIRRKFQKELYIAGVKHLEKIWQSYVNSITKNGKFEKNKLNNEYALNKKEIEKGFGYGFINKFSKPVKRALLKDQRKVESSMKKLISRTPRRVVIKK